MSWTKNQFILAAFEEIGISNETYQLQDYQLNTALKRLDSLMSTWDSKGLRLSYPLSSNPSASDININTTVPDRANEAIYLNLALRIAPAFGKVATRELKQDARRAYRDLLASETCNPVERQLSKIPKGQGNKSWRYGNYNNKYIQPQDSYIDVGCDGALDLQE